MAPPGLDALITGYGYRSRAEALFETAAEVLAGLGKAFADLSDATIRPGGPTSDLLGHRGEGGSALVTVLLVVLAVGFAYRMGAHYTGACMGMPHALSAISACRALAVMAPLTLIGATFASHGGWNTPSVTACSPAAGCR